MMKSKDILFYISLIILIISCQRKHDYVKQEIHYYPEIVFKSIGDFWTLQYSNDSAALEVKSNVKHNPIVWRERGKLDYRYSLKNDLKTLEAITVNDTIIKHSDWGIYAKNEEGEDTLIHIGIDLVFGQILFEENEIWIITEIHCNSENQENFDLEFNEASISYSFHDYTEKSNSIWGFLEITFYISREKKYIRPTLSNMLSNKTNSDEISYSPNDNLIDYYQYEGNKKLLHDILQEKKPFQIRGTNIFNNNKKEFQDGDFSFYHSKKFKIKKTTKK